MKFSESVCVALVASLTEEMTAQSIAYHAHGTADGDKFCCYPWLVCHDIKSAMHCSLRLAPTMINHLTSIYTNLLFKMQWLSTTFLNTLDEWEKEVKGMPDMTNDHKNRLLLSRETCQGLKITGNI